MSDDTTTIEITEEQRDELKALKKHDRESYKAVIGRLLSDADAVPAGDHMGAAEFNELLGRLEDVESAAREATDAAQSVERSVEDLR